MIISKGFIPVIILIIVSACGNNTEPIVTEEIDPSKEIATDVEMIYSDSAVIKFRIVSPRQFTYEEEQKLVEEYPEGLHIEFFDEQQNIISSIQSNYAKRVSEDGIMTLKDEVVLVNHLGDELSTTGIVWDELNHTLRTAKFVQLVKGSTKDTSFGYGFYALDDFSKFSITQFSGKRKHKQITKEIGLEE